MNGNCFKATLNESFSLRTRSQFMATGIMENGAATISDRFCAQKSWQGVFRNASKAPSRNLFIGIRRERERERASESIRIRNHEQATDLGKGRTTSERLRLLIAISFKALKAAIRSDCSGGSALFV